MSQIKERRQLTLKGFKYQDLFEPKHLQALDQTFLQGLQAYDANLHEGLISYRHQTRMFAPLEVSELLIGCAPYLETFVVELFGIEQEAAQAMAKTVSELPVFVFKNWFVLRQAKRRLNEVNQLPSFSDLDLWLTEMLHHENLLQDSDKEMAIALLTKNYMADLEGNAEQVEKLTQWCIRALADPIGQLAVKDWVSFHLPKKIDYFNLVPVMAVPNDPVGRLEGLPEQQRLRDGFKLTDHRMSRRQVMSEIDYCVYCHEHEGDFCSKGFPVKKGEPALGLKKNPLGETETGCPLEEKISEMHVLKKQGFTVGSLAMIMVDNPMCPATGHRICNDCMKACIYQKQEPVDIPQTETGILMDVLTLPWGVEIYDLLTRWNPLRQQQWVARPYNGLKVLVMGMGPAGFTLAHHLLMEGFAVVGVDGLKIEPLSEDIIKHPIYDYEEIKEELDDRVTEGFGGVAEYGITVRWDKNFLKLIYLTLSRRPYFQVFGGVRFGGTLKVEDAWALGFQHLAIAVGAGLPKELPIPGSMAPGMRQANDFLMALQLTGAAKKSSLANLQVRLPAVVIGGGLTGIDTATEVQAYYIAQVEKTLERYELLSKVWGEARLREYFDEHAFEILNEFLVHGRAIRAERELARKEHRSPNLNALIRAWGGVTVAYRGLMRESPAYKRNHEEVAKAFEEGIYYAEGLVPKAVRLDKFGHVSALISESRILNEKNEWITSDEEHVLPARAIFVATGAKPNIAYEFEHRGTFHREGMEYQAYDSNGELKIVHPHGHVKDLEFGAFTSYQKDGYRVTFLGDTHPLFHGSVVKAIASAKRTYPKISHLFDGQISAMADVREYKEFAERMNYEFKAIVKSIKRHTPSVVELVVQAPLAARNFRPGQFYRLQNYEVLSVMVDHTKLQTEAIAVLGASANVEKGTLSFMIIEKGASSRLIATFKVGDALAVMGPTGVRTKIPHDKETVLILGGRLSVAYMQAIGKAMREQGNQVLYFAGFKSADELFNQDEIEASADKIIYVTQTGKPIKTRRPQDRAVTSDFLAAMLQYARGELDGPEGAEIPFQAIDRVLVVGSQRFLRLIQNAREDILQEFFVKNPTVTGSAHGAMQCMLKGVCAQCLTWQIDPATGKRTKAVFTCSWQDQPLDMIDLENLEDRLTQNHVQEVLTNLWLDYLFAHYEVKRI